MIQKQQLASSRIGHWGQDGLSNFLIQLQATVRIPMECSFMGSRISGSTTHGSNAKPSIYNNAHREQITRKEANTTG